VSDLAFSYYPFLLANDGAYGGACHCSFTSYKEMLGVAANVVEAWDITKTHAHARIAPLPAVRTRR
jgi:hypothetical protein